MKLAALGISVLIALFMGSATAGVQESRVSPGRVPVPFSNLKTGGQRVEVSRDLWISSVAQEQAGNNGGSPKLKLKGIQEFFLIDFDPTPFRGRKVIAAQLHLHVEAADAMLRTTVSTIASPWEEGDGSNYSTSTTGSSFLWQKGNSIPWPGDSGDITGVVLGQSGSRWGFADPSPRDAQDWQILPVDPQVVQDRLDGKSHGFFVIDDVGSEYNRDGNQFQYRLFPNRFFGSRDSNRSRAPYFTIWFEVQSTQASNDQSARHMHAEDRPTADHVLPTLQLTRAETDETQVRTGEGQSRLLDLYGLPIPEEGLYGARGEAICFFVPSRPEHVQILHDPGHDPDISIELFRSVSIAGEIDPLLPGNVGSSTLPAPSGDKTAGGLTFGPTLVEVYIHKSAKAGPNKIRLQLDQGKRIEVPLHIWDFQLPDRLSFIPQMNCYGVPERELDYMKLAHHHRLTLNHLRYGWSGKTETNAVPARRSDGSWDWTAWDAEFGPLFDGTAFRDERRPGVPIEAFYLPLNENWPMNHEAHFRGGYWIENAYDAEYWTEFQNAAREFATHFADRKWHDTMFEFYLNNKLYFKETRNNRWDACSAAWVFDEPVNTQDFWALRRFGLEFKQAVSSVAASGHQGPRFMVRADISRPEWQRDLLDGVTDAEVVSGALRQYSSRIRQRSAIHRSMIYMYGSANPIGTPNWIPVAWCVEAWSLGADGVVPWQTVGRPESWHERDELALLYPTTSGPVPSIRLKAFRAGQQLVEYLTLYQQRSGVSREVLMNALRQNPAFTAKTIKRNEADAGNAEFSVETWRALESLRHGLGQALNQPLLPEQR
ncbi:MAG: DUF4091 domain-containing protein [Planctomyces sp.]|nr:DUF4091 domain-containing protein [Planctomyces sp.]